MTVLACVRILADTIASLPWKAYNWTPRGAQGVKPQPAILRNRSPASTCSSGSGWSSRRWRCAATAITWSRRATNWPTPRSLLPLHPDVVFLERRPDLLMWFDPLPDHGRAGRRRTCCTSAGSPCPASRGAIPDQRQAAVAIGVGWPAEEYGYRYFKESANPSGILFTDRPRREAVHGSRRTGSPPTAGAGFRPVLTNGFIVEDPDHRPTSPSSWRPASSSVPRSACMYGVPPILIGDTKETTAWGTGVEQITLGAITYTFRSWTSCIESMISVCSCRRAVRPVRLRRPAARRHRRAVEGPAYQKAVGASHRRRVDHRERAAGERGDGPGRPAATTAAPGDLVPANTPAAAGNPPRPMDEPGTFRRRRSAAGKRQTGATTTTTRGPTPPLRGAPRNGRRLPVRS